MYNGTDLYSVSVDGLILHLHDERVDGLMEVKGDLRGLSRPVRGQMGAQMVSLIYDQDIKISKSQVGYRVTLWFCTPTTNTDRAWKEYLTPFANAAKDHTPPFHQYLDDDDQP